MAREGIGGPRIRPALRLVIFEGSEFFRALNRFVHVTYRMGIALGSLVSGLVALYLHLWKLGLTGSLACSGANGCEYVQGSKYGWFMGVDVALIGAVGYALLFIAAMVGTMPAFENARWPNTVMALMIWPAVLFTLRLKYYEFIVLKGFCPWCLVSAVTITLCAILITLDRRRLSRVEAAGGALQGVS